MKKKQWTQLGGFQGGYLDCNSRRNECQIFQEQKSRYVSGFSLILQKIENCN
jgi:hypothetical protein